jgi:site-specific recombinase XerD
MEARTGRTASLRARFAATREVDATRPLCELATTRWTMHTLRHRFSSRAYRGTRNLRAVQTLLGHASIATTDRYLAVDDDEILAAMEAAG